MKEGRQGGRAGKCTGRGYRHTDCERRCVGTTDSVQAEATDTGRGYSHCTGDGEGGDMRSKW